MDDPDKWERGLEQIAARRTYQMQYSIHRPDGTERIIRSTGRPHFDEAGQFCGYRGSATDITRQVRMEQDIRANEERFRDFAELAADWFWETDEALRYVHLGGRFEEVTGRVADELLGASRMDLVRPWLRDPEVYAAHERLVAAREPFDDIEYFLPGADGERKVIRTSGRPIFDAAGQFTGYRGTSRDVTGEHRMSEELTYRATHDALTGLVNRAEFEARLNRILKSAVDADAVHAVCYLDLDQFKVINDTAGHIAGDELLRQIGALLETRVRRRDTLARLGGDEFGVLMEHCSIDQAQRVAISIRDTIETHRFSWGEKSFGLGVSIGLVPIDHNSVNATAVMSAADSACYAAKDQGRNRVHVYWEDDAALAKRHGEIQWVTRIQGALEEDRFELVRQPIVSISGPAAGERYELLVRLRNENGDLVPPGAFLPAAERYNLASKIDRWVVSNAFKWLRADPARLESLELCSINLSGHSLAEEAFLSYVAGLFEGHSVDPEKICFEITETAAIANLTRAVHFVSTLRGFGCRFALDDFGSGLSSFAYLKNLDVDYLKIDGQFVKDIVDDPIDRAMVKSINEIVHVMNKRTVAEFVENEAIMRVLRDIGVDFAQGFGVGRPQPLDAVAASTE